MIDCKRGDLRIMRVTEIDGGRDERPLPARLLPRGAQVHSPERLVLLGREERRIR